MPNPKKFASIGRAARGSGLETIISAESDARTECQTSGEMADMEGIGLCTSAYNGASVGRNVRNKEESHSSLPVKRSSCVTVERRDERTSEIRQRRRWSLGGSSVTVKVVKLNCQPIQTTVGRRLALCQLMGTHRTWSKMIRTEAVKGADERSSKARMSST